MDDVDRLGSWDRESVVGEALEVHGDHFVDELFGLLAAGAGPNSQSRAGT